MNKVKLYKLDSVRECLDLLSKEDMDLQGFLQSLIMSLKDALANANSISENHQQYNTPNNKPSNFEHANNLPTNEQSLTGSHSYKENDTTEYTYLFLQINLTLFKIWLNIG